MSEGLGSELLTGVYSITNTQTEKVYVGSAAVTFRKRWREHRNSLRNQTHHSIHLQRAWNKYGESSFKFSVLEVCDPSNCVAREQFWMNKTKSCDQKHGYNINQNAGSVLGMRHTKEVKESIAKKMREFYLDPANRETYSKRMRAYFASPDNRERASSQMKERFADPQIREEHSRKIKRYFSKNTNRNKQSKRMSEVWSDESRRAEIISKMAATRLRNKLQKQALAAER